MQLPAYANNIVLDNILKEIKKKAIKLKVGYKLRKVPLLTIW